MLCIPRPRAGSTGLGGQRKPYAIFIPRINTRAPFPTVDDREGGRCIAACREAIVPSPHKPHP